MQGALIVSSQFAKGVFFFPTVHQVSVHFCPYCSFSQMESPISSLAAMWAPSWKMWSWSAFMATKPSCWWIERTRWRVSACSKRTAVRLVFTAPLIMGCVTSFCKAWPWSLKTSAASHYSGKNMWITQQWIFGIFLFYCLSAFNPVWPERFGVFS